MLKKLVFIIALMSFFGISAFAQEWEYIHSHDFEGNKYINFVDAEELDSGDFLIYATHSYLSGYGDYYSGHPALLRLSPNGEVVAEKRFFKSGYCGELPFVFEKDNGFIAITSYSPDRDDTYFNYHPEVQDGILAYYKLDSDLNILDSVDYHVRLDTILDYTWWQYTPNETNPFIIPFSVIEDETGIVGVYNKISSLDYEIPYLPKRYDTLTFFRMNHEGEIIHSKDIPAGGDAGGGDRRHYLFRTDTGYTMYGIGMDIGAQNWQGDGPVLYFDEDFNFIQQSFLSHNFNVTLEDFRAKRTSQNIVYLTCEINFLNKDDSSWDARIMKVYDDFNTLQVEDYSDRGTLMYDFVTKYRGIDFINEHEIFWSYTLNVDYFNGDSWIVIEKVDEDLNIISEVSYEVKESGTCEIGHSILATEDGGVLLIGCSSSISGPSEFYTYAVKFPAEAFMSVEEAHKNNLHVAMAFPNPGNNVLNIKTSLQNASVEVYDIYGKVVYKQDITENITSVPTESWNSGMYLWKVYSEGKEVESGKWVKR